MYVKLQGKILIERKDGKKITFTAFNAVEIEKDMSKINSTCKIKIPISCRLNYSDKTRSESVQTAKQFSRGDKITVWLGYSGELKQEFTGFIYRLNYTTPLEIECEGYEFQLRSPIVTKTWKSTTLKEVLQYIVSGTEIKLHSSLPSVNFTKFIIKASMTRLEALQFVKDTYGLTVFFVDNVLYAGLAYTLNQGTVKYKLGWNTIKDGDMKYRNADDVALKIKAVWIKPDNTKVEAEVGDPSGNKRTLFFYNVSSKKELEALAKNEIQKYKYSGYEGDITTFLVPFCQPGMKAGLIDPKFSERGGTYYVSKVKVKADRSGGRRIVNLSLKL